jgi:hypothetical protein
MAGKKRKATDDITACATRPRRQSGRVEKPKLNYQESDDENLANDAAVQKDVSESESPNEEESEDAGDDDELDDFEKDLMKKGYTRKRGKGGKWEMVIELPKPKDDGGKPYEDKRIHPNTLGFLRDLKKNNQREWLKFHDAPFR